MEQSKESNIDNSALKSNYRKKKDAFDKKVYDRFTELKSVKGSQVQKIYEVLLKEFPQINSGSTIWSIRKRVEALQLTD